MKDGKVKMNDDLQYVVSCFLQKDLNRFATCHLRCVNRQFSNAIGHIIPVRNDTEFRKLVDIRSQDLTFIDESTIIRSLDWSARIAGTTHLTNPIDILSKAGCLQVIKWLHENCTKGCTEWAMNWAAKNRHLDVVT